MNRYLQRNHKGNFKVSQIATWFIHQGSKAAITNLYFNNLLMQRSHKTIHTCQSLQRPLLCANPSSQVGLVAVQGLRFQLFKLRAQGLRLQHSGFWVQGSVKLKP